MPLDKSNSEKTEPSMNVAKKNRAAFFVFYEKDGNVADWVVYYLNALKEVAGTLCVIVNGKLSNSGRELLLTTGAELLLTTGAELLLRENFGFDFSAWKVGLEKFGKNRLAEFDEIILCNNSCYGPVVSFAPIFKKMDAEEADFWGLLFHAEPPSFPEHLQSYFLVLRKKLVQSEAFSKYWKNLRQPKTYDEARKNEVGFTRYFIDAGFKAVAFVPRGKYCSLNPTIYEPCRLLAEDAFPLVKRKVFSLPYRYFHAQSRGLQARDALAFLDKKNKALAEMIRRDLLKTVPDSRIRENLHHTFFFPDAGTPKPVKNPERVALIVYSYFEDLIDEDLERMKTMPAGSSVFIVVVSEKIKKFWEAKIPELGDRHVEIRVQENRGRNEAAYWLTCRDVIEKYELICVAHDKKSVGIKNRLCTKGFSEHCWENTLKSQIYVENVIEFFDKNPSFGILLPPTPNLWAFYLSRWRGRDRRKNGKIYARCLQTAEINRSVRHYAKCAIWNDVLASRKSDVAILPLPVERAGFSARTTHARRHDSPRARTHVFDVRARSGLLFRMDFATLQRRILFRQHVFPNFSGKNNHAGNSGKRPKNARC